MKINISHLGAITNAQIELKPLTVFVGDNNTGKTWAAYAIASILGHYGQKRYLEAYLNNQTAFKFQPLEEALNTLSEKGSASINLKELLINHAERYINEVALLVPQWLDIFMATKYAHFDNTTISVEFPPAFLTKITERLNHFGINAGMSVGQKGSLLSLKALKDDANENLYYYITSDSAEIPDIIKKKEIEEFVTSVAFDVIRGTIASNTPIFPMERTTFITLPLSVDNQAKKPNQNINSSKSEMLSEPVKYFLAMLNSSTRKFFDRKKQQQKEPKINHFISLAHFLENDILLGEVEFEEHGNALEVLYKPTDEINLEVKVSSSMIKELAPLSLYLKYVANLNDLVIIDEPEMNLHPAAQAEMTEFMGMLVNSGLNLLITTHSPYIIAHLENLMRAWDNEKKEKIKKHFYLEREEAFISKDEVSVYFFDDGKTQDVLSNTGQIEWDTFSDVSSDIAQIYSKIG
ncbi:MAG TPA: ATP-binding protein [Thiotrichaceae bacterium]|nr:ATP-binding protein [Thiotrichaceae bacterium]